MIPVVSDPRSDGLTSFHRLGRYLTQERVAGSEILTQRGPVLLSDNLLSQETAMIEMKATASLNPRVGDPILHFQLSWRESEQPTRTQWEEAARTSLQALGFAGHQYMVVAHDDTDNFHIHLMVNRVHPDTYSAHNPRLSNLILHKTARELEHTYGWEQDHGLYRWDATLGHPVRTPKAELITTRQNAERPRGGEVTLRGKMERFNDQESVRAFAADKPARALRQLLNDPAANWNQVHAMLGRHGLEIHSAERGGYTVNVEGSEIKVKASDVFRFAFSGKDARTKTDVLLGPYTAPLQDSPLNPPQIDYATPRPVTRNSYAQYVSQSRVAAARQDAPPKTIHHLRSLSGLDVVRAVEVDKMLLHRHPGSDVPVGRTNEHFSVRRGSAGQPQAYRGGGNSLAPSRQTKSEERKAEWKRKMIEDSRERRQIRLRERQSERTSLKQEFHAVRSQHRTQLHNFTESALEQRKALKSVYLSEKAAIRKGPEPWVLRKAYLSQRTAEYVIAKQTLTLALAESRAIIKRPSYQQWVEHKAETGDKRAAAQIRGWRYQDKRNVRKQESEAFAAQKRAAGNLSSDPELPEGKAKKELDWEMLANERLRRLREEETIPALGTLKWKADAKTGNVTYMLAGIAALVDRGKTITVLQHDQAATRIALEMAIHKYGRTIQATGSDVFQRQLIQAAVQQRIEVVFTDPQLQARLVAARQIHHKQQEANKQRNSQAERGV